MPVSESFSGPANVFRTDAVPTFVTVTVSIPCPTLSISSRILSPGEMLATEDTLMLVSPAFASDLTSLMHRHRPELWIHGHTHYNVDYAVGSTRVVSHQWGYPNENVARGTRVVEV